MQNTKDFGLFKIPGYGNRKRLFVTAKLIDGKLSITGEVKHGNATIIAGQVYEYLRGEPRRLWERWHLNDLRAGTSEQMAALSDMRSFEYPESWYSVACEHLKAKGLYEVELDGKPYKFGERWLFEEIPADELEKIKKYFFFHKV